MRSKLSFIIFWTILVASFLFFASVLILEANGLRINFKSMSVEKTGLIILNGEPKNIVMTMNGTEKKINLPIRLPKLLPGTYEISLSKDGYQSWHKIFQIKEGMAEIAEDVYLFFNQPKIKPVNDSTVVERIKKSFEASSQELVVKENEIWLDDELITRFSQNIKSAILAKDESHIVFQSGKELRVIEIDGANNTKLIDLNTDEIVAFMIRTNKIYYVENGFAFEAQVR